MGIGIRTNNFTLMLFTKEKDPRCDADLFSYSLLQLTAVVTVVDHIFFVKLCCNN